MLLLQPYAHIINLKIAHYMKLINFGFDFFVECASDGMEQNWNTAKTNKCEFAWNVINWINFYCSVRAFFRSIESFKRNDFSPCNTPSYYLNRIANMFLAGQYKNPALLRISPAAYNQKERKLHFSVHFYLRFPLNSFQKEIQQNTKIKAPSWRGFLGWTRITGDEPPVERNLVTFNSSDVNGWGNCN